jgi:hypothetical protein
MTNNIHISLCLACGMMLFSFRQSNAQQKHANMNITDNALLIEQTEIEAWRSLIDAAPDSLRLANGMKYKDLGGGLAINFQKKPDPLFNRVIGLGLTEPLTQELIDSIKAFYTHHEKYLVHYSSPMQPSNAAELLKQNGFYLGGSWERIVRDNKPLPVDTSVDNIEVRLLDESLRESWVRFLIDTYGYDFYWWPRAFAFQKGWKHYVALRDNKIIACRSYFITKDKTVFSGVDAPVPGVMTSEHAADFAIWRKAIRDCLEEGAVLFVADIELPDKEKNKEAYDGFKQLGFTIPYTRYHYRLNK